MILVRRLQDVSRLSFDRRHPPFGTPHTTSPVVTNKSSGNSIELLYKMKLLLYKLMSTFQYCIELHKTNLKNVEHLVQFY